MWLRVVAGRLCPGQHKIRTYRRGRDNPSVTVEMNTAYVLRRLIGCHHSDNRNVFHKCYRNILHRLTLELDNARGFALPQHMSRYPSAPPNPSVIEAPTGQIRDRRASSRRVRPSSSEASGRRCGRGCGANAHVVDPRRAKPASSKLVSISRSKSVRRERP